MKYSIEGHLALLLRSWQTSLTLTKVYPLLIKRSKTKAAQIISVVFKWFTIHFVGYFYFRPGEYEGEGRKVKVVIKSWRKGKMLSFWHLLNTKSIQGISMPKVEPLKSLWQKKLFSWKALAFKFPSMTHYYYKYSLLYEQHKNTRT